MLLTWCEWHNQGLCNVYENVDMSMLWSICRHGGRKKVPRRWNKNGATATYPKMMPRQHIGSGSSRRYRCKGTSVGAWKRARDGGVLPVTGFPQVSGTAKEGHHKDDSITVQNSSISFNTCIRSTAVVVSGLYLRSVRFRSGSSRRGK